MTDIIFGAIVMAVLLAVLSFLHKAGEDSNTLRIIKSCEVYGFYQANEEYKFICEKVKNDE